RCRPGRHDGCEGADGCLRGRPAGLPGDGHGERGLLRQRTLRQHGRLHARERDYAALHRAGQKITVPFESRILGRTDLRVSPLGIGASYGVPAAAVESAFERGAVEPAAAPAPAGCRPGPAAAWTGAIPCDLVTPSPACS